MSKSTLNQHYVSVFLSYVISSWFFFPEFMSFFVICHFRMVLLLCFAFIFIYIQLTNVCWPRKATNYMPVWSCNWLSVFPLKKILKSEFHCNLTFTCKEACALKENLIFLYIRIWLYSSFSCHLLVSGWSGLRRHSWLWLNNYLKK